MLNKLTSPLFLLIVLFTTHITAHGDQFPNPSINNLKVPTFSRQTSAEKYAQLQQDSAPTPLTFQSSKLNLIQDLYIQITQLQNQKNDLQGRLEHLTTLTPFIFSRLSPASKFVLQSHISGGHLKHSHNIFKVDTKNNIISSDLYDLEPTTSLNTLLPPGHTYTLPVFTFPVIQKILEYTEVKISTYTAQLDELLLSFSHSDTLLIQDTLSEYLASATTVEPEIIPYLQFLTKEQLFYYITNFEKFGDASHQQTKFNKASQSLNSYFSKYTTHVLDIINLWHTINTIPSYSVTNDRQLPSTTLPSKKRHIKLETYYELLTDPLRNLYFPYLTDLSHHYSPNFWIDSPSSITNGEHYFFEAPVYLPSQHSTSIYYNVWNRKSTTPILVEALDFLLQKYTNGNGLNKDIPIFSYPFMLYPPEEHASLLSKFEALLQLTYSDTITKVQLEEYRTTIPEPYTVLTDPTILSEDLLLKLYFAHALAGTNSSWAKTLYSYYHLAKDLPQVEYAYSLPASTSNSSFIPVLKKFNTKYPMSARPPKHFLYQEHAIGATQTYIPSFEKITTEKAILPPLSVLFSSYNGKALLNLTSTPALSKYQIKERSQEEILNGLDDLSFTNYVENDSKLIKPYSTEVIFIGQPPSTNTDQKLSHVPQDSILISSGYGIKNSYVYADYFREKRKLYNHLNLKHQLILALDSRLSTDPSDAPYIIWLYQNVSASLPNAGPLYIHVINTMSPEDRQQVLDSQVSL